MFANYHTHTFRCRHAGGEPEDYVKTAIANGLTELGFSDHVPYPFLDDQPNAMRMAVAETESYVNDLLYLRKKYSDKINIFIGYEAEYYPEYFEEMLENIKKYECDYLILGQHFINADCAIWSGTPCGEDILIAYIDRVISAIKTEKFSYIAHPDLINYHEDMNIFRREITRLCNVALEYDVPLEFNLLGFREGRHYPYDEFWKIVAEIGCMVIIGCDAHSPEHTGDNATYSSALEKLQKFGITPIEKLTFKKI